MRSEEFPSGIHPAPHLPTILVVEDEEGTSEFITQVLEHERPAAVLPVADATQALEAVHSSRPSLVIVDYRLPGMDGLELADRLHSIKECETVPTLMISVTGPAHEELHQRHIPFLKKPFDLDELLALVDHLLPPQEG